VWPINLVRKKPLFWSLLVVIFVFQARGVAAFGEELFSLGTFVTYMDYTEPEVDVNIKGPLYGLEGRGIFRVPRGLYSAFIFDIAYGTLDYSGYTWAGAALTGTTDDWLCNVRYLVGYEFWRIRALGLSGFLGVAFRYWHDRLRGASGYAREISYWYSPLGLMFSYSRGPWRTDLKMEYDIFWRGKVKSHLSDVDVGFNDPENTQKDGYGWRMELEIAKKLSSRTSFSVTPYWVYWNIDQSDLQVLWYWGFPQTLVYEPANHTYSYGLRLNIIFQY